MTKNQLRQALDRRHYSQIQFATIALIAMTIIIALGACVLLGAYYSGALKLTGSYATTQLIPGTYSNTIECEGSVQPMRVTNVTTKATGAVTKVYVHNGQYVPQGTILFDIGEDQSTAQAITSSVAGTVANISIHEGTTSAEIESSEYAMQIMDMNVLVGMIQVPEYVAELLENGQYITLSSSATPNVEYGGIITGTYRSESASLSSSGQILYDAKVVFDGVGNLHVGDPLIAKIYIDDYGQVYYVPAAAVEEIDGAAYIDIVRASGTVEQHQIELLGTNDDGYKIITGNVLTSETVIRSDLSE